MLALLPKHYSHTSSTVTYYRFRAVLFCLINFIHWIDLYRVVKMKKTEDSK